MRESRITLSIVSFLTVLECDISKMVNKHGSAVVKGYIDEGEEKELLSSQDEDRFASICISSEGTNNQVLFAGLVESISVTSEGGLYIAKVTLTAGTRLLDCIANTRTFQNKAMTYRDVLKMVEAEYHNVHSLMHVGSSSVIDDLVVQYKETDWTFIKRLASHFNMPVLPYYKDTGIRYQFGLNEGGNAAELTSYAYESHNDLDEYYEKQRNKVEGLVKGDSRCYVVKSREYFELGDKVSFNGKILYVYSVQSKLDGSELIHTYMLKTKGGFKQIKKYNTKLIGASLSAKIISISKDTVKIHVLVDASQEKSSAKWFAYSTVYSSPDGTGWYCMPEEGDRVRLYFPNEKEEEGYVISSIHVSQEESSGDSTVSLGNTDSAPRSNPDNKSISTKYNKQVEFTPTSITMTNNDGMMVKLDDSEGISIISDKNVVIESADKLSIKSKNSSLNVEGAESVILKQGESTITMEDEITVSGAKFIMQ